MDRHMTEANREYTAFTGGFVGSPGFDALYAYEGELGALYAKDRTAFRLWAPTAAGVWLDLYDSGDPEGQPAKSLPMTRRDRGVWDVVCEGDMAGTYYTFTADINGQQQRAVDPYAKAAGVNGKRGMVIDLAATNPVGWDEDEAPPFHHPNDAVIYELHIRDLSTSDDSGIANKGKYLAFTETGTASPHGLPTGIDHIAELGVTHVHLLPCFDFCSIDETRLEDNRFNWGYDPQNYNLPEGSYATDPRDGSVRVREFKQMVQTMHAKGLRVVMDVVYNHTGATADSHLNLLVPGYYYRQNAAGGFSNGSGCGNETASGRAMVRKLIIDSAVYWATEYHVDGFRFDLMGLHDTETMNAVRDALDSVDASILLYGEGWTGGETPLPYHEQATKHNAMKLDQRIAFFSDDMRDGIKGSVFDGGQTGYVSGDWGRREDVRFGAAASVRHPQIDYSRVSYSKAPWAAAPSQTINYASAHDNLSLWDKLRASRPDADEDALLAMNKLSALLVLTSQGIPFFQAGEEFARSKQGDGNSYQSPDSVNQLKWANKTRYQNLFEYYKGLIALRRAHPAFRLQTAEQVAAAVRFLDTEPQVLAYVLNGGVVGDETFLVAVNIDDKQRDIPLPHSGWTVLADGGKAGVSALSYVTGNALTLAPRTGCVLVKGTQTNPPKMAKNEEEAEEGESGGAAKDGEREGAVPWLGILLGLLGAAAVAWGAIAMLYRRNK